MLETSNSPASPKQAEKFEALLRAYMDELPQTAPQLVWCDTPSTKDVTAYSAIRDLREGERVDFVEYLFKQTVEARAHMAFQHTATAGTDTYRGFALLALFRTVLKTKIEFTPEEAVSYLSQFIEMNAWDDGRFGLVVLPFGYARCRSNERSKAKRLRKH